jgi:AmmeMemoRadiSam system protein A
MIGPDGDSSPPVLPPDDARALLEIARSSIRHGLNTGEPLKPLQEMGIPDSLARPVASFVTLNIDGALRGCIGSLEACRPLVDDVAHNAFAAAFRDPRFPPLSEDEFKVIELHISLLGPATPMEVTDERDLVTALRPGMDGLILEDPPYRSVFLPQVWDSLPEPTDFVAHLKLKAGLSSDHWSPNIKFSCFTVDEVSDDTSS